MYNHVYIDIILIINSMNIIGTQSYIYISPGVVFHHGPSGVEQVLVDGVVQGPRGISCRWSVLNSAGFNHGNRGFNQEKSWINEQK